LNSIAATDAGKKTTHKTQSAARRKTASFLLRFAMGELNQL
jgi:hypothetical protein